MAERKIYLLSALAGLWNLNRPHQGFDKTTKRFQLKGR